MKFKLISKFVMYEFEDECGTSYRTYDGENWEQLMGDSWETIYSFFDDLKVAFKNERSFE